MDNNLCIKICDEILKILKNETEYSSLVIACNIASLRSKISKVIPATFVTTEQVVLGMNLPKQSILIIVGNCTESLKQLSYRCETIFQIIY